MLVNTNKLATTNLNINENKFYKTNKILRNFLMKQKNKYVF